MNIFLRDTLQVSTLNYLVSIKGVYAKHAFCTRRQFHLIVEWLMEHSYISQATRITFIYKKKYCDWKPVYTFNKILIIKMIELSEKLLNDLVNHFILVKLFW